MRDADFTTQPLPGDANLGAVVTHGAARSRGGKIGILSRATAPLLALRDFLPKGHHDTAANATFKSVESDRLDTLYAAAGITWGCAGGGQGLRPR